MVQRRGGELPQRSGGESVQRGQTLRGGLGQRTSFHTAGMIREREGEWEEKGLVLYRLPAYCPQLNLIEGVWRRLKGFLMPRRFYDSVAELREAVLRALHLLGAVEIQCLLGDT